MFLSAIEQTTNANELMALTEYDNIFGPKEIIQLSCMFGIRINRTVIFLYLLRHSDTTAAVRSGPWSSAE